MGEWGEREQNSASRVLTHPSHLFCVAAMGSLTAGGWPQNWTSACHSPGVIAFEETEASGASKGDLILGTP